MGRRFGRYEVIRPLAAGGMAQVYVARSVGAGGFERLVAIKAMHSHIALDPEFVNMFLDEARLAARIRHPNVVATHDIQQGEDGLFLVMDYVDGPTLPAILQAVTAKSEKVPLDVALRIFLDVLAGLHAAHELRDTNGESLHLVHRDVSPQNVLVGREGITRITDFGVASARSRLTTTRGSGLKGKIAYLSPEQIQGQTVDRRSDLFAAGIVLWETLTLRRLFRANSEGATLTRVLAGAQESPRTVNPDVPEAIDRVVMKALSLDPAGRHATALELAEALEEAAEVAGVAIAGPRKVAKLIDDLGIVAMPDDSHAEETKSGGGDRESAGQVEGIVASGSESHALASTTIARRRRRTAKAVGGGVLLAGLLVVIGVATRGRDPVESRPTSAGVTPRVETKAPVPASSSMVAPVPTALPSAETSGAVALSALPLAASSPVADGRAKRDTSLVPSPSGTASPKPAAALHGGPTPQSAPPSAPSKVFRPDDL